MACDIIKKHQDLSFLKFHFDSMILTTLPAEVIHAFLFVLQMTGHLHFNL
jgi:hypothetical protein